MLLVAARDLGGLKVGADDALGRTGLLDLGDNCRTANGDLVADGRNEITRRRLRGGLGLDDGQRPGGQSGGDFFALGGDDLVEDVAHHLPPKRCVH